MRFLPPFDFLYANLAFYKLVKVCHDDGSLNIKQCERRNRFFRKRWRPCASSSSGVQEEAIVAFCSLEDMGVAGNKDVDVHLTGYSAEGVQVARRDTLVPMNEANPDR